MSEGVLVTGIYGVGKTSVIEEMAEMLEAAALPFGAVDLDWLWWFDAPGLDADDRVAVLAGNLAALVGVYAGLGVQRFLIAGSMRNGGEIDRLQSVLPFPLRVVRLVVPIDVVRRRLRPAVTSGRLADLQAAERWLAEGLGSDLPARDFDNDRPVGETALEILDWLGWMQATE